MQKRQTVIYKLVHYLFFLFLIALVLYFPSKIVTCHLVDFSYQEITNEMWIEDRCYYPGESENDKYDYGKNCKICQQIVPADADKQDFYIKEGNKYLIGIDRLRKVYLKKKPDFFHIDRFTGGELHILDYDTGITCTYYSYE